MNILMINQDKTKRIFQLYILIRIMKQGWGGGGSADYACQLNPARVLFLSTTPAYSKWNKWEVSKNGLLTWVTFRETYRLRGSHPHERGDRGLLKQAIVGVKAWGGEGFRLLEFCRDGSVIGGNIKGREGAEIKADCSTSLSIQLFIKMSLW